MQTWVTSFKFLLLCLSGSPPKPQLLGVPGLHSSEGASGLGQLPECPGQAHGVEVDEISRLQQGAGSPQLARLSFQQSPLSRDGPAETGPAGHRASRRVPQQDPRSDAPGPGGGLAVGSTVCVLSEPGTPWGPRLVPVNLLPTERPAETNSRASDGEIKIDTVFDSSINACE